MINDNAEMLTRDVLAVMSQTRDPRLREIMTSLAEHLHGFIRDTRLTEQEFRDATALIAQMGQQTSDTHNEVVLMAGSLGVSSLVCLLNNGDNGATETSQNLLGPFWRMHSPRTANGGSIVRSPTPGAALRVAFTVVDRDGRPVEGVDVDIWHSSPVGLYENQDVDQADMNLRGTFTTDAGGKIWFTSVKPAGYPIPTTGVVGQLLSAQDRHPYRPAHVHALAFKPGYKTLISQVYADDDPRLHTDAQFGVTRALLGRFVRHDVADAGLAAPFYSLEHTLVLESGEATLPRPPIK
jgi:catechol 1,2-dioxygenase